MQNSYVCVFGKDINLARHGSKLLPLKMKKKNPYFVADKIEGNFANPFQCDINIMQEYPLYKI